MKVTRGSTGTKGNRWRLTALAGLTAVGVAVACTAGAAAGGVVGGDAAAAAGARGHGSLERDARAVVDSGATAVVAAASVAGERGQRAAAGVTDLDDPRRVDPGSYYRIGSDTKTFTAVVVLQLVAEGRLDLGDTVERWLPGVVTGHGNDGSRVTVRNLLQHTSGIANYTDILFGDPGALTPEAYEEGRFDVLTPEDKVALAMTREPGWLPDAASPGSETRWSYSNTNYILAGMIVERVTGHSWEREVHERVIAPLGLDHTLTSGTSAYVPQPTATAYLQFPGQEELTDTTLAVEGGADGGIISTAEDMTAFHRALLDGRLLGPAELAEMRTTVPAPDFSARPGTRYGLGLAWSPMEGCDGGIWFHGGTSFGTSSEGAVTDDGRAAAEAGVYTLSFADAQAQEELSAATRHLVEHALCGTGD